MGSILFLNEEIREPDDVENALLPKRPQEELPIGSLGRAELDSLVEHGHKEAEATELAAGFMGGAGPLAVRGWVFLGCSMLAPTIFNVSLISSLTSMLKLQLSHLKIKMHASYILNIIMAIFSHVTYPPSLLYTLHVRYATCTSFLFDQSRISLDTHRPTKQ